MIRIKGGGEPIARTTLMAHYPRVPEKTQRTVTKPRKKNNVTRRNTPEKGGDRRTGKVKAPTPPPAQVPSAGRPKVHATPADRQRAYRERQKEAKA